MYTEEPSTKSHNEGDDDRSVGMSIVEYDRRVRYKAHQQQQVKQQKGAPYALLRRLDRLDCSPGAALAFGWR